MCLALPLPGPGPGRGLEIGQEPTRASELSEPLSSGVALDNALAGPAEAAAESSGGQPPLPHWLAATRTNLAIGTELGAGHSELVTQSSEAKQLRML